MISQLNCIDFAFQEMQKKLNISLIVNEQINDAALCQTCKNGFNDSSLSQNCRHL